MKRLLIFLILLWVSTAGFSQSNLKGVLKSVMILDKQPPKTPDSIKIGGLSAIEYYQNSAKKEPAKWIFASDRKTDQDQSSYLFENNDISRPIETLFSNSKKIEGLENVESARYNPRLNTLFFALEKDDVSQIVYLDKKKKVQVFSTEKLANGYITKNRGIEGLTFMPNIDMWYAFESGGCTDCAEKSGTVFRKIPYTPRYSLGYDGAKKPKEYAYEMDRCSCIRDLKKPFDGGLGNGVSEILALDESRMLILERCYDGEKNGSNVKLFIGTIDEKARLIRKGKPIFNFNDTTDYKPSANPGSRPDNIEGMTWGPKNKDGKRLLYLISDDNYKTGEQWTQVFVLSLEPVSEQPKSEAKSSAALVPADRQPKRATDECDDALVDKNSIPQVQSITTSCAPSQSEAGRADNCQCKLARCICRKPAPLYRSATIDFSDEGSITSNMPEVLLEDQEIILNIDAAQPKVEETALEKSFNAAIKALGEAKAPDEILRKLNLTEMSAQSQIETEFTNSYQPYILNTPKFEASLNGHDLKVHWVSDHYEGSVDIINPADERGKQTLLLIQNNPENQFFKDVFNKSRKHYRGWAKYKNAFERLHAEYAKYARKIDELLMIDSVLTKAGDQCQCPKYDIQKTSINDSLCVYFKKITLSETQLCAIALDVIKDNRCWMRSWLWYTGGKPRLNPFRMTSAAEFNNQVDRRLAEYEELLSFYHDFARQCREAKIPVMIDQIKGTVTQISAEIASLKKLKQDAPKTEARYQAWLKKIAATERKLNDVLLYSTGTASGKGIEAIHWMNHYNAGDDYIKMNKPNSLPERVYERDLVHGLVHNLTGEKEVSAKETVTETKLRTELDIQFDPIVTAFTAALSEKVLGGLKKFELAPDVQGFTAIDSATTTKSKKRKKSDSERPKCEKEKTRYLKSKVLIDWLFDQTEPPVVDLEAAYKTFNPVTEQPAFHSKETLVGESRSAEGTNVITYEIFEKGKEKAVVTDKYQTYETIRWWPFVSIDYVFKSRSTAIFDPSAGTFTAYTDIDNFEVFAGAKWYFAPSNVTRTHKRTRFISETVGKEYNAERGNGGWSKTFAFVGLGVRHNFLKNYGAGVGYDLVPGFSAHAGLNLYFRKKYELVNGIVKKEFDVPNTRWFIGVSIDANIVTRLISIF